MTTTATVSQTPQRFKVCENINSWFLSVGTDVPGCPIGSSGKSKHYLINRIIPLCHALLTSFVGRGLAPAVILFGQPRTSVPTVRIVPFWHPLLTSFKASFALQGRWLRALAKKTVGSFGGRPQFISTGRIKNSHKLRRGDLWSPALQRGGSKPPPYGIRLLFLVKVHYFNCRNRRPRLSEHGFK